MGISIVDKEDFNPQQRPVEPKFDYSIFAPKANPNLAAAISTSDHSLRINTYATKYMNDVQLTHVA